MKPIRALALITLLLCLTLSLCLASCQNEKHPKETDSDTVAADTVTTEPDESIPTDTMPDETAPADTNPPETVPADTAPIPDDIHIPDPSVGVGNAATMMAGGEIGSF